MENTDVSKENSIIENDNNMTKSREIITVKNTNNSFSISEMEYIQTTIEKMDIRNQIEALKIIHSLSENSINENKYGIHINLTELSDNLLSRLNDLIKHTNLREIEFNKAEKKKEIYMNDYFK